MVVVGVLVVLTAGASSSSEEEPPPEQQINSPPIANTERMVKNLTTFFIISSPQIKYTYYCEGQIAKCQHKWCLPSNYAIPKKIQEGFFLVIRRRGAPLVPRKRYEPNRRRAEGRWRKGMDCRISQRAKW